MMIPITEAILGEEELAAVSDAIRSGWVSSKGVFITEFEKRFAAYCGRRHGVATSNGTAALHLALAALGIGKGDEVIVPTFTFIATVNAVTYTGAKPVLVDSDAGCWCIDAEQIKRALSPRTRAIIPVHIYGHPCDMDPIIKIARDNGLYLVEDAAEAHGAEYNSKKIGSFGDVSCFSFYGNKIITTGEGGMCLTDDDVLAQNMRIIRDHGMSLKKKYVFDIVGYNYRMTNMQAALGVAQLGKIDYFIRRKREIADTYKRYLKNLSDRGLITLHPQMEWAKCVFWMYSILIEDSFGSGRDSVMAGLEAKGVETRPLFYPIHTMKPYRTAGGFSVAESLSKKGLSLPSSANLEPEKIKFVADAIKGLVR